MNTSTVLVFAAFVCCASALQEILFPGLREITKSRDTKTFLGRRFTRHLSESQKCDKLLNGLRGVIDAVESSGSPEQVVMFKQGIQDATGIDISDKQHMRDIVCRVAGVSSLADLAEVSGVPESVMRQYYSMFVNNINSMRSSLRDLANASYITPDQRRVLQATVRFYDIYEEIGMLSLS